MKGQGMGYYQIQRIGKRLTSSQPVNARGKNCIESSSWRANPSVSQLNLMVAGKVREKREQKAQNTESRRQCNRFGQKFCKGMTNR